MKNIKFVEVKIGTESSMIFNIKKIVHISMSSSGRAIIQTKIDQTYTSEQYDVVVKRVKDLIF